MFTFNKWRLGKKYEQKPGLLCRIWIFSLHICHHENVRLLENDLIFKRLLREKANLPRCLPKLFLKTRPYVYQILTLLLPGPYICVFKQISDQINGTRVPEMFCGRSLVNLIITLWRRISCRKYKYFSSFGAGNFVSNSSFKWMKNNLK